MEILAVLIIGIGVAFAVTHSNRKRVSQGWGEAASRLQIHYNAGDFITKPELYGVVQGCRVKITIRTKNQGRGAKRFTRYEVDYPRALGFSLCLTEQSAFAGLKKFLGAHDIEVGDPNFDDFVVVRSHDSDQTRGFLNPARRLYIRRILSLYPGAEITDSQVRWDSRGVEREPSTLVSNVNRIVDFALNMTVEGREQPDNLPEPLGTSSSLERSDVALEVVFTGMGQRESPEYTVPASQMASDLVAAELAHPAAESEITTGSTTAEESIERMGETSTITPDGLERPTAEQADRSLLEGPTVAEVCSSLFGSNTISYQANEIFKQSYAGSEVRWSGKLTRVDRYPFDLVFGSHPGTKAELEISEIEGDSFETRTVKAVVQLPTEAHDALASRTGEAIAFAGTLVRCDSFTRVLFVGGGRLVKL